MLVSIIIPTRNRAAYLQKTLQSLANVDYIKQNTEIIVADNGSTDNTGEVCQQFKKEFPDINFVYLLSPIPGLLSGRHDGAKKAQGDILTFIDDDIIAHKQWLQGIHEAFSDNNVHLAGGKSTPLYEVQPPYWIDYLWSKNENQQSCGYLSLLDYGNNYQEIDPNMVWGLNFSIRRSTFINLQGFHPDLVPKSLQRFQGDGETGLTKKLQKQGLKALYSPLISVQHIIPAQRLTIEYFENRMFYQGVCNSFSDIRQQHFEPPTATSSLQNIDIQKTPSWWRRWFDRWSGNREWHDIKRNQRMIQELRNEIEQIKTQNQKPDIIKELDWRLHNALSNGYIFHQHEVKNDPQLLQWVLQPHYLDVYLPTDYQQLDTSKRSY